MRALFAIVGALIALIGLVWLLQGMGLLPGSFMTGQRQWAVYGAVAIVAGVMIILLSRRRLRD
ncbi:MAG TPA: hypothetical protein VF167_06915 [Longimicrobiaceae bacterium]